MGILEEVKRMQKEGKNDDEIHADLEGRGASPSQIKEALSESQIKDAVSGQNSDLSVPSPHNQEMQMSPRNQQQSAPPDSDAPEGMQPSLLSQEDQSENQDYALPIQNYEQPSYPVPAESYPQYNQGYAQEAGLEYGQEYQYPSLSSDTITEISEQVVEEKVSKIKDDLRKVLDMRTTHSSRLEHLEERLKRIEGIIDRLQLSVLQKVGDQLTNIAHIKQELIETQKSFKSLLPGLRGHSHLQSYHSQEHNKHKSKQSKEIP